MTSLGLPKHFDPFHYARTRQQLVGKVALSNCPRLQALADQADHVASIDLSFDQDERGCCFIKGSISASVSTVCERCNQLFNIQVDATVSLSPITSEARAKSLPSQYDPLVTHGEPVYLISLVEEEILLALPMAPKHPKGGCPVPLPDYFNA